MNQGWIKLRREILEKPIWTGATSEQKVLLITLLMMANHSEKEWEWQGERYVAKPGQFVTSLKSIVERDGRTLEQITHLMKWSGQHPFWHAVILSPTSIRRNWDQMAAQVKQEHVASKGQSRVVSKRSVEEFTLDFTKGKGL